MQQSLEADLKILDLGCGGFKVRNVPYYFNRGSERIVAKLN